MQGKKTSQQRVQFVLALSGRQRTEPSLKCQHLGPMVFSDTNASEARLWFLDY